MAYQVFHKTATRVETPALTIRASAKIAINAAATRILVAAGVRSVLLLWDSSSRKIALKAAPKGDKNAFLISIPHSRNAGSVRAKTFLRHIGWKASQPVRFAATWNEKEKMLEIELVNK
jgi:hypothetical protein